MDNNENDIIMFELIQTSSAKQENKMLNNNYKITLRWLFLVDMK
jgi:hypothetical protein